MSARKDLDRAVLVPLVCERLSTGKESLTTICRELGFERRTFNKWRREDPAIDTQASVARQEWCESLEEDLLEIADDSANDYHVVKRAGAHVLEVDSEAVARSKLRFYARERLLKAYHPTRWGEKVHQTITGPDDGPLQVADASAKLLDLLNRRETSEPTGS